MRTTLLLAFAAVSVLFGLADTCPTPIIEARSWDGYNPQFRPAVSDEEMIARLREHDALADKVVHANSLKYLPPSMRPSIEGRNADAKAEFAATSGWFCRFLW